MNDVRRRFHVYARLSVIGNAAAEFDDAKAGRPVERRLNRMERVVIAFAARSISVSRMASISASTPLTPRYSAPARCNIAVPNCRKSPNTG